MGNNPRETVLTISEFTGRQTRICEVVKKNVLKPSFIRYNGEARADPSKGECYGYYYG